MKLSPSITLLSVFAAACAPNIGEGIGDSGDTGSDIDNVDNEGGTTTTTIDATDYKLWVYMDFESGELVMVSEPETDLSWDIAFQRYHPKINGGVSGSGEMEVAIVTGADFDSLEAAPDSDYTHDLADADEDGVPEYAMATWYDYDPTTHVLSPADQIYVLRTVEGGYVKLRFDQYYDEAGTSGYPQFTWGFIDEPSGDGGGDDDGDDEVQTEDDSAVECSASPDLVTTTVSGEDYLTEVNSASASAWSCLSFSTAAQVESDWSFAWQQWTAVLPEGTAGVILEGEDYDAVETAPEDGWLWNNMTMLSDWYDYDPSTHILTPKDRVYVFQDASGAAWKLQIESYYDEADTLHRPTFRWAPLSASQ
jgi:hypothetical protein